MWRRYRYLMLAAVVLSLAASRAHASFHLMKIVEIFPGTSGEPNAQYIMLQMYFGSQNFVSGHSVTVFDASGAPLATFTFPSDVPNGANQATILIATPEAQSLFGVAPDLTMTPVTAPSGGEICYESIDCVSWGSFGGSSTSPSPSGTPFNATTGIPLGMAMRRNLGIDGNPATLSSRDDTDNSASDFVLAPPAPRNNRGKTVSPTPTATATATALTTPTPTPPIAPSCIGDCDGSGDVTVSELITMVNIALGNTALSACAAGDADGSGTIEINEIVAAVNNALNGCP